jgi:sterol desaturase/sphingolipid hydroxylase (fatty acid hydroxylase superfamily)
MLSLMQPLYGGGFLPAFAQLAAFYYALAAVLYWLVPRVLPVKCIQKEARGEGEPLRDAVASIGARFCLCSLGLCCICEFRPKLMPKNLVNPLLHQPPPPQPKKQTGPLAVKAAYWTAVEAVHAAGVSKLYAGPIRGPQAWLYVALTIALMDHCHDAWFYWTHRLLHWRPLYRYVHHEHHRSRAPSPFTGYAFHWLEAALVFANELVLPFVFPIHMGVHRVYHLVTTAIHEGAFFLWGEGRGEFGRV